MAFWSGETLKERLPQLVHPYNEAAIDCAAYTLHVGSEIYVSPDRKVSDPTRHAKKRLAAGEAFTIPAGQFGWPAPIKWSSLTLMHCRLLRRV